MAGEAVVWSFEAFMGEGNLHYLMETRLQKANLGFQSPNLGFEKANPGFINVDAPFKKQQSGLQKA